jgi:branched-chain amino acid transport system permease protein
MSTGVVEKRHGFPGAWLAILAAVVVLPLVVRHAIAAEIWIFAIFGLGLNLLLGYTGLLSFGQATFFGSAGYVAGYLLKHHAGIPLAAVLALGIAVGAVSAAAVGYLCVQRSGLYFIMLTFALNQMFYFTAYQWTSVTGGEDGMPGISRPPLLGLDLTPPLTYYVFVAVLFVVALWVMKRVVASPLGTILQAIRENEVRAEAVGYDARRFKLLAFVIGGAFSGLAGVLYAMLFGIVPLEAIGFVFSGNVVFATLIGGSGSLYGPIIGAFVFIWLSESVSVVWQRWPLLLGVAFVVVVLFFRGGVVEAWERAATWGRSRRAPA